MLSVLDHGQSTSHVANTSNYRGASLSFLTYQKSSPQWQKVLGATSPAGRAQEEKATRVSSHVSVNYGNNGYM